MASDAVYQHLFISVKCPASSRRRLSQKTMVKTRVVHKGLHATGLQGLALDASNVASEPTQDFGAPALLLRFRKRPMARPRPTRASSRLPRSPAYKKGTANTFKSSPTSPRRFPTGSIRWTRTASRHWRLCLCLSLNMFRFQICSYISTYQEQGAKTDGLLALHFGYFGGPGVFKHSLPVILDNSWSY